MLIECGPRFVRRITVLNDSTDPGPRHGSRWLDKVGTIVSWDNHRSNIGRALCDWHTDAVRVGMEGLAGWLEPRVNQHYQQWYDQLPKHQICAILPVYLYETACFSRVSTTAFAGGEFDAGQCGWIYCTNKSVRQKWPKLRHKLHELRRQAYAAIVAEIQELDLWLRDGAYLWRVEDVENSPGVMSGDPVAAGGGFYGFNPNTNGMMDTIPKQYKHLLEAWCNERGLSRP